MRTPSLVGWKLRLVTGLMENRLARRLLLSGLLRDTGIAAFRKLQPEASPRTRPLVEPEGGPGTGVDGVELAESVRPGFGAGRATIGDYARAYREGRCSPVDVAEQVWEVVETSNAGPRPLRAVITCDRKDLLRQAAESAERLSKGRPRSVLEGVPVAVKDELDMVPYGTGVGTSFLGQEPARADAAVVARLRAAGALLVGKTNMFEIGISPTGDNPHHGFARNPHDPGHDAGGSSGGSAAAVASGLVPLAVGADGGGSIRIPSSHCGVVGLKPTYGRVSEAGAAPLCGSVAHVGPIGATVRDVAIGYALCAGPDPADPMTVCQPPVSLGGWDETDLSGVRLGIDPEWFEDADPEIVSICRKALEVLRAAGAEVREVSIAGLEAARVAHAVTILSEMSAAMEPHYHAHRTDFAPATRLGLVLGRAMTGADYLRAQRVRAEAMAEWKRVFKEVDVVVTPATACLSPVLRPGTEKSGRSDLGQMTELMRFAFPSNLCGHPAMSVPAGHAGNGLPVGLQLIGRHWEEHLLLRLAGVVEGAHEERRPALVFDPLEQAMGGAS